MTKDTALKTYKTKRHCEERRDEAISLYFNAKVLGLIADEIASPLVRNDGNDNYVDSLAPIAAVTPQQAKEKVMARGV